MFSHRPLRGSVSFFVLYISCTRLGDAAFTLFYTRPMGLSTLIAFLLYGFRTSMKKTPYTWASSPMVRFLDPDPGLPFPVNRSLKVYRCFCRRQSWALGWYSKAEQGMGVLLLFLSRSFGVDQDGVGQFRTQGSNSESPGDKPG